MFGVLTEKLQNLFSSLSGQRKLTESNVKDAVKEVKQALLEADVNYGVVQKLVHRIKERAIGDKVLKTITPSQQFVKIVHDELVKLMGEEETSFSFEKKPTIIMLCGLQGSGKTTQCAKIANYFRKKEFCKKPLLVACDLQRLAAVEQLEILGDKADIPVFSIKSEQDPVKVAKASLIFAKENHCDCIVVDTAGRLHIDQELMTQLEQMKKVLCPQEILFVANAATGQDAVNSAKEFNQRVEVTGTVLTMLDGNTRAGAAISIAEVTQKPLKFEGIGERVEDIQLFNPHSMADRILGMGDVINLVRKTEEAIDQEEMKKVTDKIRSATFTYDDYLSQIQMVKKMGSFSGLMSMMPGMGAMKGMEIKEDEMVRTEAIIRSMTLKERQQRCELLPSRRQRIAKGSGTTIDDVNRLVKSFKKARKFFKNMPSGKKLNSLKSMLGGKLWQ